MAAALFLVDHKLVHLPIAHVCLAQCSLCPQITQTCSQNEMVVIYLDTVDQEAEDAQGGEKKIIVCYIFESICIFKRYIAASCQIHKRSYLAVVQG